MSFKIRKVFINVLEAMDWNWWNKIKYIYFWVFQSCILYFYNQKKMKLNTTTLKWSFYIVKSIGKILCVTSPNANHWPSMTFGYIRLSFLNTRKLVILFKIFIIKKKHMQKYLTKFEKKKFLIIGIISEKYYWKMRRVGM